MTRYEGRASSVARAGCRDMDTGGGSDEARERIVGSYDMSFGLYAVLVIAEWAYRI